MLIARAAVLYKSEHIFYPARLPCPPRPGWRIDQRLLLSTPVKSNPENIMQLCRVRGARLQKASIKKPRNTLTRLHAGCVQQYIQHHKSYNPCICKVQCMLAESSKLVHRIAWQLSLVLVDTSVHHQLLCRQLSAHTYRDFSCTKCYVGSTHHIIFTEAGGGQ